jgi:hypothetical protein
VRRVYSNLLSSRLQPFAPVAHPDDCNQAGAWLRTWGAVLVTGIAVALAGCGSHAAQPKPVQPKLPRALAHAWAQQADAIAASLAENDGCGAQTRVAALQQEVVAAVNAHRIPRRLLEPLSSGVNDLAAQITCTPPPAPKKDDKHKGHKKHGHDKKGND